MTFQFTPPASGCVDPQVGSANCRRGYATEDIYFALTGRHPDDAALDDDGEFDNYVFASLIAVAAAQGSAVNANLGLSIADFRALLDQRFPGARRVFCSCDTDQSNGEDEEVAMVRALLLAQRSTEGEESRWLASMLARRAVEPNHLWEDLGLRNRMELSRLLARHFAPLAMQNTRNMRWKRFFYRMLCEADGMVICTTPVCTDCTEIDLCFGEETGESRLAQARRAGAVRPES